MAEQPKTLDEVQYHMTGNSLDRNRPYDGQPHTDQGERGKTVVAGLTMRDVCDCFVRGWLHASGRGALIASPEASYNDVYSDDDVDQLAVMQNMMCEVEKLMGIFPNVPPIVFQEIPTNG